jgi:hypothetical protein
VTNEGMIREVIMHATVYLVNGEGWLYSLVNFIQKNKVIPPLVCTCSLCVGSEIIPKSEYCALLPSLSRLPQ